MTPSGIAERQNELSNLQLLAAQRQLYSEEKKATGLWYAFSISVAVLFMATSVFPFFKLYGALLAFFAVVVALSELYRLPQIRQKRITAAMIQEQFDWKVLDLEWNDALADKPDPKTIEEAVQRFNKRTNREKEWKKLKDWYENPTIDTAPIHVARIACIKENVHWDSGQRLEWARWITGITIGVMIILVITGIQSDWLFKQYFSGLFLLLIPPLIALFGHVVRHREAAKRLDHLAGVLEDLRRDALREHVDIEEITRRTRYLQTEICHHRMEDVPVFDWFYNKLGKKYAPAKADDMWSAQQ